MYISVSEMYFFFLGSWGSQDSLRLKLIINSRRQTRNGLSDTLIVPTFSFRHQPRKQIFICSLIKKQQNYYLSKISQWFVDFLKLCFPPSHFLSWVSLFLSALFLCCFEHALSRCSGWGPLQSLYAGVSVQRLVCVEPGLRGAWALVTAARGSVAALLRLWSSGSVAVMPGLSCLVASEICLEQGCNPHSLHWQMDSYPPCHQGCPVCGFLCCLFSLFCVEFCNPQKFVTILTPSTLDCDLIWKQSLYRDNQFKMSSQEWSLISCDCCSDNKEKFGHRDTPRKNGM